MQLPADVSCPCCLSRVLALISLSGLSVLCLSRSCEYLLKTAQVMQGLAALFHLSAECPTSPCGVCLGDGLSPPFFSLCLVCDFFLSVPDIFTTSLEGLLPTVSCSKFVFFRTHSQGRSTARNERGPWLLASSPDVNGNNAVTINLLLVISGERGFRNKK